MKQPWPGGGSDGIRRQDSNQGYAIPLDEHGTGVLAMSISASASLSESK